MSFNFDKVVRGRDVVQEFPIRRWEFTMKFPFLVVSEKKMNVYYPQLTIGETGRILKKYLNQDISKEKINEFPKSEIIDDLFQIYKNNKDNHFLKRKDLKCLNKEELMIMIIDTVQRFVKKKLREVEEGKPYLTLRYLDLAFTGERSPLET